MDFTIEKLDLIAAIDKCALAVDPKSATTPAHTVMLVEATKKKTLRCAAVGPFCSVDTVAAYEMKQGGQFYVRPARLRDIAQVMPPGKVRVTMEGTRVTVKSVSSKRVARFEATTVDVRPIDDPGKNAAWITLDAHSLIRNLKTARPASIPDGRDDVPAMLLLRKDRGIDIFACNMYLVAHVETEMRAPVGAPIIMTNVATALLPLMATNDDKVRLYADDRRVYLENCDTLVSGALPVSYNFMGTHENILEGLRTPDAIGPTLRVEDLTGGVRSVLACAGFAEGDDKGSRGFALKMALHDTAVISLAMSVADAKDEFEVVKEGAHLDIQVESKFMGEALSMLAGIDEVQAYESNVLFVMRSAGIIVGVCKSGVR